MADHSIVNGSEIPVYNLKCIDLANPDIHQTAPPILKFHRFVPKCARLCFVWFRRAWRVEFFTNVGRAIGRIIALALDLNVDFFDQPEILGNKTASYSNMFHYGVPGTDFSKEIVGAPPHCDLNFITLLATDEIWGLQICREKNAQPQLWEAIPPVKGAFIVNVGDMLEMLSNGAFRYPTIKTGDYILSRFRQLAADTVKDNKAV
ncbi:hypothetical protein WN944_015315 [Citrus x changshan-huyou]|uniref:Isopenicillin N synthase-like Fe(2+) 2OG dioxygenase domain-containing protein n=1 Tax=Citrus x changshan-huyou TaxID=2935761 RepID=A0AAP0QMG0_9ROSI